MTMISFGKLESDMNLYLTMNQNMYFSVVICIVVYQQALYFRNRGIGPQPMKSTMEKLQMELKKKQLKTPFGNWILESKWKNKLKLLEEPLLTGCGP